MKLTREQVEAMLAGATPDWMIYSEPEVGLPPSLFAGKIMEGINPLEPLTGADLTLAAAAPDLARELLAAWDREAKLQAVADAAIPFVSPVQNADYGRQLRQYEALSSALAALGDTP